MQKKYYLAIDIGASSGRHMVGWKGEDGKVGMEEVYRFPNGVDRVEGHLTWDMERLLDEVKAGISVALRQYPWIESLAIDTWAVDYVLMRGDQPSPFCYAYRDGRTEKFTAQVHEKIPFAELYQRTGIQFQPFNTIYQLYADQQAGRLENVTDFLMVPEYLLYRLTGVKRHEYTNATTTGLVNAATGRYDMEIVKRLGLPKRLFGQLTQPGTVIGEYHGIKAVLGATHDTASAVEGIPMEDNQPYLSSGTWSLLGVKTKKPIVDDASRMGNWSNEGGVRYHRYQKNIMGMWLVNGLRRELCPDLSFEEINRAAEESGCQVTVDANAPAFLAPESMKDAFDAVSGDRLRAVGDYFRCAYRSLAESYRVALEELEQNTGKRYEKLYIVGGGAQNQCLNRMTQEAIGREVAALPIEATALGNLKLQMRAMDD